MQELAGRVALITGASRGIGRAIALALADQGAAVIVNYHRQEAAAAEVVAAASQKGVRALAVQFDVSDSTAVEAGVRSAVAAMGGLDILVNNAGMAENILTLGAKDKDFHRAVDVNLGGTFFCTRVALRWLMRAAGGGRIVNVTSVVAETGSAGQGPYTAAKAGIIGLTKTWAREYASRGVTVNVVSPGLIETDMIHAVLPEPRRTELIKSIPLGRIGEVEDIAHAVAFLVSPRSSYITGQVIRVNGGLLM